MLRTATKNICLHFSDTVLSGNNLQAVRQQKYAPAAHLLAAANYKQSPPTFKWIYGGWWGSLSFAFLARDFNPYVTNVIYIDGAPILDVSRSHTTTHHSRPCRSPPEIAGSNPTEGMDICLLWVSCVVIKNGCSIYIYDISRLKVNNLTLILLTRRK